MTRGAHSLWNPSFFPPSQVLLRGLAERQPPRPGPGALLRHAQGLGRWGKRKIKGPRDTWMHSFHIDPLFLIRRQVRTNHTCETRGPGVCLIGAYKNVWVLILYNEARFSSSFCYHWYQCNLYYDHFFPPLPLLFNFLTTELEMCFLTGKVSTFLTLMRRIVAFT